MRSTVGCDEEDDGKTYIRRREIRQSVEINKLRVSKIKFINKSFHLSCSGTLTIGHLVFLPVELADNYGYSFFTMV